MSDQVAGPHSLAFPGLFVLDALSEDADQAMDAFLRTAAAEEQPTTGVADER